MRGSEVFQLPVQRTGMLVQGLKVAVGFIGLALLPASKINAHQLICQGATGLVVLAFVTLLLLLVIALGPRFLLQSAPGIFVKGLPAELGTAVAEMNRPGVAALNHYGCDAVKL